MNFETIIFEKEKGIAKLKLNRPERLNALNWIMLDEVGKVIEEVRNDDSCRVLIVTGVGRAFCSGGDIKELQDHFDISQIERRKALSRFHEKIIVAFREIKKPVIASINGDAIGAGCGIAMACHIRISSERARYGFPFLRVGAVSDMGCSYFLPRLVGIGKAMELFLTANLIDSLEAEKIGLINKIVVHDNLEYETTALANRLTEMPPIAIAFIRDLIDKSLNIDLITALENETDKQVICYKSEDHREGVRAFLEKREPNFIGR
jgi:enoyl-CoA hydratase/carnithine racemase